MHIPLLGFVLLAFLLLGVVLAVAVFFAFKSGNAGQTKLSGPAGCLIALALLVIAGIGAAGLAVVALVTLHSESVHRDGGKTVERTTPDRDGHALTPIAPGKQDLQGPRLSIELRGLVDTADVMKWLRKHTDAATRIDVHDGKKKNGKAVTVVELTLPDGHDAMNELRDLRKELEGDVPELQLPKSAKIEFSGPDD